MYPENVNGVAFNLLESHDTPRIATVCNENTMKVKQMFTFLLSSKGSPCIYYGDEIGMTGHMDPGCRKCMIWEEDKQDQELLEFVSKLIRLRKDNQAFGNNGIFKFLSASNKTNHVMYTKIYKGQTIVFVYNNSNTEITVDIPLNLKGQKVTNLLTGDYFIHEKDELDVVLPSFDHIILLFN